jgi:predicted RNA-binding Zn ribbon-like protein
VTVEEAGESVPDPRPAPPDLEPLRTFVNSDNRYFGHDHLRSDDRVGWFGRWLPELPVAAWERVVGLRDAIRAVLGREEGAEGRLAVRAAAYPLVLGASGPAELAPADAGQEAAVAAAALGRLHRASVDGRLPRLRLCGRPDCQWCYYDSSRNGSARWCSAEPCGDVMKTRAFRDRQRRGR